MYCHDWDSQLYCRIMGNKFTVKFMEAPLLLRLYCPKATENYEALPEVAHDNIYIVRHYHNLACQVNVL